MVTVKLKIAYPNTYRNRPVLDIEQGSNRVRLELFPGREDEHADALVGTVLEELVVQGLKYNREFAGEMRAACDAGEERARKESMR